LILPTAGAAPTFDKFAGKIKIACARSNAMALYDAFISYSHAKDKPIAAAVQSVVQKLGKAWYQRRALRVFRDDTSLSATPQLWPTIEQALGQSRFFVLLASPEAAASKWVNKEVGHWLEHNSIDTLLIGVTAGDLAWDDASADFGGHDAVPLPPALKGRFAVEPKWVDLRGYRDGVDPRDSKFIELGADFAAAIRGMPKEDLLSQEVRQQRRALRLAWSAAGSLLILAGAAAWQWNAAVNAERIAVEQKGIAEEQRSLAEKNEREAVTQQQEASRQRDLAVKNEQLAVANEEKARRERDQALLTQSRFLADLSQQQTAAGDATAGMLLALEALPDQSSRDDLRRSRPYAIEAERALYAGYLARREERVLRGHGSSVIRAQFTADGRRVLTTSADSTARLWDVESGRTIAVFKGHAAGKGVLGAAFSPDERRLVTWSSDGTAKIWDVETARTIATLEGLGTMPAMAAFIAEGRRVVTAAGTTVRIWDVETGVELVVLTGHKEGEVIRFDNRPSGLPTPESVEQALTEGAKASINDAALSADRSMLVTVAKDKTARAWDLVQGRPLGVFTGHAGMAFRAAISPDGRYAASSANNPQAGADRAAMHDLRIWETASGKEVAQAKVPDFISSIAFSADGRSVLISQGKLLQVLDAATAQSIAVYADHTDMITRAAFVADGTRILSSSFDGTAILREAKSGRQLAVFGKHVSMVYQAALSPDGTRMVTAGGDWTARIWALQPAPDSGWTLTTDALSSPASFSADSRLVAVGAANGTARIWSTQTGKLVAVLKGHGQGVGRPAFSPDSRYVLTHSNDGTVRVWEARTGRELAVVQRGRPVTGATFNPDGTQILVWFDNAARIYDRSSGDWRARMLSGHSGAVTYASYSADGRRIATSARDRTVRVWDAATGREQLVLTGHVGDVWSATFAHDGRRVVSVSADRTARVWDSTTGESLAVIKRMGLPDQAEPIDFGMTGTLGLSRDGRHLAVPYPLVTEIWDLETLQQVKLLSPTPGGAHSPIFSPDGQRLVTVTSQGGGRIHIWDWQNEQVVASVPSPHQLISSAALSPDGSMLATGELVVGLSHRLWRMFPSTQPLVDHAKTVAPRCLVNAQRAQNFLAGDLPPWCFEKAIWPIGRTRFGIQLATIEPADAGRLKLAKPEGVIVTALQEHGPAARAGIKQDDVIVAVNGKPAADAKTAVEALLATPAGERAVLSISRGGEAMEIAVTVIDPDRFTLELEHERAKALIAPVVSLSTDAEIADALEAADHARRILEDLVAAAPDNADWQESLAFAYEKMSDALLAQRKLDESLARLEKSVAIREQLGTPAAADAQRQIELARILTKIGDVLRNAGRRQEALARYRASLAIREALADAEPSPQRQQELAAVLERIGLVLAREGSFAAALESDRRALAIREKLVAAEPNKIRWTWEVALSHEAIGNVLAADKKWDDALDAFRKCLAIREAIAAREPDDLPWQRGLAIAHTSIGRVLAASGRVPEALESFRRSLAIRETLAASASVQSLVDLMNGCDDVARLLAARGENEEALQLYRKSLDAARRVAAVVPGNVSFQQDLATSYERVGWVQQELGRDKEALDSFKSSVTIRRDLASRDQGSSDNRNRLRANVAVVGHILMRLEAPKDALSYFDEAVKLAPDQAVTYFDRGRANRYAELPDAAARDMERAVKLEPTNPYRVVWLHLVRLRSGQEDRQELTANAERLAKGRWPWPIVELYFGATTPEAVRAAVAATADVRARSQQSCQADFYAGVHEAERGARENARQFLQSAAATCRRDVVEHSAAKFELKRLDKLKQ
jgi:WD40 repeat protein/tetratricopeptide (TPR) repeat protein